ncbi:hypothetical protein SAMN04488012_111120 [Palleronia salina]|uniref:Uncharacterized protein n=1 Tax=Palleronia salina TaxID=313368 RepID=A0A1M6KD24_9RHOB|nr:hypothetical protein SAMN04488012_111120 [Palleronia salina]
MLLGSVNTSVAVNGLYILARDLQSNLGHYSFNLFASTHDETHRVRLLGSATPL